VIAALLGATLIAAATTAPPTTRFRCDASARALLWEQDTMLVRTSAAGLTLEASRLATPDRPLAPSGASPTVTVGLGGGESIVFQGTRIDRCQATSCATLGRLAVTVWDAVASPEGLLVAAGAPQPGLYRLRPGHLGEPELLQRGEVLTLCPADDGAFALIATGAETTLVTATAASPVVSRLSFADVLDVAVTAPASAPSAVARAFLGRSPAERRGWALRLLADPRPEARALAAPTLCEDPGAAAAAGLFALSEDTSTETRRATLAALIAAAPRVPTPERAARLALFVDDPDTDLAWRARDELLEIAPEVALLGATPTYKLDALAQLSARAERSGATAVQPALSLLTRDPDDAVRAAAMALRDSLLP
jgi:hypothetical protein